MAHSEPGGLAVSQPLGSTAVAAVDQVRYTYHLNVDEPGTGSDQRVLTHGWFLSKGQRILALWRGHSVQVPVSPGCHALADVCPVLSAS